MKRPFLQRDRKIYAQRIQGQTFATIAKEYKISNARVQQIFRQQEREMKRAAKGEGKK